MTTPHRGFLSFCAIGCITLKVYYNSHSLCLQEISSKVYILFAIVLFYIRGGIVKFAESRELEHISIDLP